MRYRRHEEGAPERDPINRRIVQRISPLARIARIGQSILNHRALPWGVALAAIILMLPALRRGLMLDDLTQRVMQCRVSELPEGITYTGLVSEDSGRLGTVLCDPFGFPRGQERAARARDFGLLPWWTPDGLQAALWRPLTAFAHRVDYSAVSATRKGRGPGCAAMKPTVRTSASGVDISSLSGKGSV